MASQVAVEPQDRRPGERHEIDQLNRRRSPARRKEAGAQASPRGEPQGYWKALSTMQCLGHVLVDFPGVFGFVNVSYFLCLVSCFLLGGGWRFAHVFFASRDCAFFPCAVVKVGWNSSTNSRFSIQTWGNYCSSWCAMCKRMENMKTGQVVAILGTWGQRHVTSQASPGSAMNMLSATVSLQPPHQQRHQPSQCQAQGVCPTVLEDGRNTLKPHNQQCSPSTAVSKMQGWEQGQHRSALGDGCQWWLYLDLWAYSLP